MNDKEDIKLGIGGEVDDSYKGAIAEAARLSEDFAKQWSGVFSTIAQKASVVGVLFAPLKGSIQRIYESLGYVILKLEIIHLLHRQFIADSQEAAAGLKEFSSAEEMETQFRSLLKTTTEAKERMAELREKAGASPFTVEDVASSSKALQLTTHGQLASGSGLDSVIELAARTGNQLLPVADAVGRLFEVIQAGEPLGRAARQMETLGLMTEQERLSLEKLQQAGKSAGDVWDMFAQKTLMATGASALQAQTLKSLNEKLVESKNEALRQVGEVYEQDAKSNVQATIDMTKALTPLTAEAAKVKEAFGLTSMPTQTFWIFDTQIKETIAWILRARDAWSLFIRGFAMVATGIGVGVIAQSTKNIAGWLNSMRGAVVAAKEWAEAEQAAGRAGMLANAVMLTQTATTKAWRYVLYDLTLDLKQMAMSLLSLPGIAAAAGAAMLIMYQRAKEQIATMKELYDTILQGQALSRSERNNMISSTDKVQALTNQYERLVNLRKKLSETENPYQKSILAQGVDIAEKEYQKTALTPADAPSKERQDLMEQLGDLQEKQLERDLTAQELLKHYEEQKLQLAEKRAALEKTAADAAAKVAPENLKAQMDELANLRAQLAASEDRLAHVGGAGKARADNFKRAQAVEGPIQAALNARIQALVDAQAGYAGNVTASENAQVDLSQNDLQAAGLGDKIRDVSRRQSRSDMEASQRQEEAATEANILDLKTRGMQRTLDEAKLRQTLAAEKKADFEADQQRLAVQNEIVAGLESEAQKKIEALSSTGTQRLTDEKAIRDQLAEQVEAAVQRGGVLFTKEEQINGILAARNELAQQQRSINEVLLAQSDEMLSQEERRNSRLEGLVSRLPKFMQKPFLQQEVAMIDKEAADLEARAAKARAAGDTTAADDFQNRADVARDKSAELKDALKVWNVQQELPISSDLNKEFGGGRITARSPQNVMAGTENQLQRIHDLLDKRLPSTPAGGGSVQLHAGNDLRDPGMRVV